MSAGWAGAISFPPAALASLPGTVPDVRLALNKYWLGMSTHLQCFLCTGYCSKDLYELSHLIHIANLWDMHSCYPDGTEEEAEAQRDEMTCPRSQ